MISIGKGYKMQIFDPKGTLHRIVGNDRVGIYMAETSARHMDKFIPMDSGILAQSYKTEPFKVKYYAPYARRMFWGENYNFQKDRHPLATARWDIATSSAEGQQIADELRAFIEHG